MKNTASVYVCLAILVHSARVRVFFLATPPTILFLGDGESLFLFSSFYDLNLNVRFSIVKRISLLLICFHTQVTKESYSNHVLGAYNH